jgi:glyoxylase-like metal-dependent hydrolase (beta-lactamase superfamily II)
VIGGEDSGIGGEGSVIGGEDSVIVRRLLAPNPGWLTGAGTNSYVVHSRGEAVVIDPGPEDPDHLAALAYACSDTQPVAVLVTHTHPDHAPGANPLGDLLQVPVFGYGPGPGFKPDRILADGARVHCGDISVTAFATPGHCAEHLCYLAGNELFTGDVVLGGSSVVVEDLAAYLASLGRLAALGANRIWPGHGDPIDDPGAAIAALIEHRLQREREIMAAVWGGAGTLGEVVAVVYKAIPVELHPAAAVSVAAHLRKLGDEGRVEFPMGAAEMGAPVTTRKETAE